MVHSQAPAASAFNHHRGRVSALSRYRPVDDPELVDERAKLEVARSQKLADGLAEYIKKVVDTWPPLTPEQRDQLAQLLRGGAV